MQVRRYRVAELESFLEIICLISYSQFVFNSWMNYDQLTEAAQNTVLSQILRLYIGSVGKIACQACGAYLSSLLLQEDLQVLET